MATTFVQSASGFPTSDPDVQAFGSNVTAGNALFVVVTLSVATRTVVGVTDSQGNTWQSVCGSITGGGNYSVHVWRTIAGSTGACSVTTDLDAAGAAADRLTVFEFAGMGASPTNGAFNTRDVTSAVTPMPLATLTTTAAGVLFTSFRSDGAFIAAPAFTDSFVKVDEGTRVLTAYRITTGGVSAAPTIAFTDVELGESLTVVVYDTSGIKRTRARLPAGLDPMG